MKLVAKYVTRYYGYVADKRKEDDAAVRQRLMSEIDKSKKYLLNVLEKAYKSNEPDVLGTVKALSNDLDVFSNEVQLSETGYRYPFFSPQTSITWGVLKELIKYDLSTVETMCNVAEACRRVENAVIEKENRDVAQELKKIRHYVTGARNDYKDRSDYIKRIA